MNLEAQPVVPPSGKLGRRHHLHPAEGVHARDAALASSSLMASASAPIAGCRSTP
jgi:hypothetical protein